MNGAGRTLLRIVLAALALAGLSVGASVLVHVDAINPWNPGIGAGAGLVLVGGAPMAFAVLLGEITGAWLNGWVTPTGASAGALAVSVLAPVVVGTVLRRLVDPDPDTWTVRETSVFALVALVAGAAVSVLVVPLVASPEPTLAAAYFRGVVSAATGVIVGVPAIGCLVAATRPPNLRAIRNVSRARWLEFAGQLAFTLLVGAAAYLLRGPTGERFWSLYFIPLLWTAFRFGMPAVVLAQTLAHAEAIVLALVVDTPLSALTNFHFFYFVFTATALLLAAALRARRSAEQEKAEGDRRFRELVDTAFEGVWTLDRDLRTTYANRRMAELLGAEPELLRGRPAADLVVGSLPATLTDGNGARGARAPRLQELQLRARTGEVKPVLVAMNPIVTADGSEEGTLLMVSDLTERVHAERAQRRSEALLAGAFRVTRESLVLFRRTDGVMLDANAAWEALTGRHRDALIGASLFTLPEWQEAAGAELARRVAAGGPVREFEASLLRSSGELRLVQLIVEQVTVEEQEFGVAFIRDVTESRIAERQRLQAQKLEAVGLLAGGVAHDFNNILTVIMASAEYLREVTEAEDSRQAEIESVLDAANRGAQLTRQLLAFSRDRPDAPPRPVDAVEAIGGVTSMLGRLLGPDIQIVSDFGNAPATVLAGPGQLEQVMLNLAVNARDAMQRRGTLTIEVRTRTVRSAEFVSEVGATIEPGYWVMIRVRDTGQGIDAAIQSRIFEPFFTTKDEKGTGLGLSTVYGIMRSVGGHIGLQSELGVGTSFVLYWPGVDS